LGWCGPAVRNSIQPPMTRSGRHAVHGGSFRYLSPLGCLPVLVELWQDGRRTLSPDRRWFAAAHGWDQHGSRGVEKIETARIWDAGPGE
jgi:hypothetical protein